MSDWQVGDLALCVDATPCNDCGSSGGIQCGIVYVVGGIEEDWLGCWLLLPEVPSTDVPCCLDAPWFAMEQFRKIRPDEHEACEPEFVTLLKRTKRTVSA